MGEKTLQSEGIMTIGTTIYDEKLAKLCRGFIEKIDYVGIGGIEVKYCNGRYYFIEMSTRTEGFVAISDMAGVSLAKAAYLDKNELLVIGDRQKEGVRYIVPDVWISNRICNKKFYRLFVETIAVVFCRKTHFVSTFFKERLFVSYYKTTQS